MATDDGTPTGQTLDDPMDRFGSVEDILRKMQNDKVKKEAEYNDLIKQAATRNNQITPTQGFALTALAALPLIVGKHLSGRTKGATALDAGNVGLSSIGNYMSGIEEEDKIRRAGLEKQAANVAGELNIMRSQEASLPGMFLKDKLGQEAEQRRYQHELDLIDAKNKPTGSSADLLSTLEGLRDQGVPDPKTWQNLSPEQQQTASRFGVLASGSERRDRESAKYDAASNLPDAVPLEGAGPLVGSDRKDIQGKRSAFIQLQEGARTMVEGIRANDPNKARTGYSLMSIAMGSPGMGNAGAALSQTEVSRKMGGIPEILAAGDLSATAFQRAIGIDPEQLAKETVSMWRNMLDTEVKANYKRDAFSAIPDSFSVEAGALTRGEDRAARIARLRGMLSGGSK